MDIFAKSTFMRGISEGVNGSAEADMPYVRSGGLALPYKDRYIFVFGGSDTRDSYDSRRPGRSSSRQNSHSPSTKFWYGHHAEVFLYDALNDQWSVLDCPMPYGINDPQATIHGDTVYVTGGEPNHWLNYNTEDVVMIGHIRPTSVEPVEASAR